MLSREQIYLDLLFSKLSPLPTTALARVKNAKAIGPVSDKEGVHTLKARGDSSLILNNSPIITIHYHDNGTMADGSTLGFKPKSEFSLNRSGTLNPMAKFSPEFIEMQKRSKIGVNNPQFGVIISPDTIVKLTKLVYVYNSVDKSYIGSYSTVQCSKEFNMGKDTLSKYLLNGFPFKGKIFSRVKLHNP